MNMFEILMPAICIVLISCPLVKVFNGKASKSEAKNRLTLHIASFFICVMVFGLLEVSVFAQDNETVNAITGTIAQGMGFIAAALATGMSSLGAGIAVAAAAPAAIGAFSENDKNFGKSMIFVALGEGVAIYGVLISILIINKL